MITGTAKKITIIYEGVTINGIGDGDDLFKEVENATFTVSNSNYEDPYVLEIERSKA